MAQQTREQRKQEAKKKTTKKKSNKGSLIKKVLVSLVVIGIVGGLSGAGLFAYYASTAPELDRDALIDSIPSEIYDINGDLYTKLGNENRTYLESENIPELLHDAVIATEDSRFYSHFGVDPIRLGGAVIANVTRGFGSEGASTITQQVVKRSFLTPDKNLKRKAQEAWLSVKLEQEYEKEEILEMYMNKVYMSAGINGFAMASEYYFGKPLSEINLPQAALLAGLPQSPNRYNPFEHPEAGEKRRDIVLSLMHQHGKISEQEMKDAQAVPIEDTILEDGKRTNVNSEVDAITDLVIEEVQELGDYDVFSDGLKIYTTIDPEAQDFVDNLMQGNGGISFPDDAFQAGISLIDTKTGEVLAVGGGRNQEVERGTNYAVDTKRQPGSTIKPIIDYAPAIEYLDWSTYHQLTDEPYEYSDGTPINNWDNRHYGQMSIRRALATSRNIPALKALQEVGTDRAKEFVSKLGLNFENVYESSSIGGGEPVSSLEMGAAFATLGNEGIYNKPHTVKRIVMRDGETSVTPDREPTIAMKDSTAYMTTDMLKDVVTGAEGTGKAAAVPGVPIAGKTGTTNFSQEDKDKYDIPSGAVPDSWFVGYSTEFTTSVWTGYPSRNDGYIANENRKIAQNIFREIMTFMSQRREVTDFKRPSSVVEAQVEIGSNPPKKPSSFTPNNQITTELFVAGTEPREVSTEFERLAAPGNFTAEYDQETQELTLAWDYEQSEENPVTFELGGSIEGGPEQGITSTQETTFKIANPTPGASLTFSVFAKSETQESERATVSIQIPEEDTDDDLIELPGDPNEETEENPGQGNEDGTNPDEGNNSDEENEEPSEGDSNPGNGGNGNDDGEDANAASVEEMIEEELNSSSN